MRLPSQASAGQSTAIVGGTIAKQRVFQRVGRADKVQEVATAIAHQPGGTVHCQPIHPDYTRVEVVSVKEAHKGYKIDYPTDDGGLTELMECKGNFILWHKKEIIRNTPSPAR